jgi:hypothetical protein
VKSFTFLKYFQTGGGNLKKCLDRKDSVCYHADYEQFHEYEKRNHLLLLSGDDCGETGAVSAPGELRAALKGYARAARQTAPDFCEIRNRQLTKGCTRGRVWPFFFCCHTKGGSVPAAGTGETRLMARRNAAPRGRDGSQPPIFVKTNCAPLKTAYGDFSRRSNCFSSSHRTRFAGLRREPCFLRKENAPLTVEKKQRRVPAKALAGIPAPGVTTGVGLGAALRYVGTIRERFSGIARGAHRLPLLSFCCRKLAVEMAGTWGG